MIGTEQDERQTARAGDLYMSQTTSTAFLMPFRNHCVRLSHHPFRTLRPRLVSIQPSWRLLLTGLRIRARTLAIHFVLLNPAMRLLVRAGCVAHSKLSERVSRGVLLDEILCDLNLLTYC
jgi:hypothetical protein